MTTIYAVIDATLPEKLVPAVSERERQHGQQPWSQKTRAEKIGEQYHPVIYTSPDKDDAIRFASEGKNRWVMPADPAIISVGSLVPRANANDTAFWRDGKLLTSLAP